MPAAPDLADPPLRRLLLALVAFGAAGLLAELVLLEHYEDPPQWIPLGLLGAALAAAAAVALRRTRGTIRVFQGIMMLCVAAGAIGAWLHYRGNVEFERERDGALTGLALFWEAIRGATPALAPGALAQLGLLGLAYAFRHPALTSPAPRERP